MKRKNNLEGLKERLEDLSYIKLNIDNITKNISSLKNQKENIILEINKLENLKYEWQKERNQITCNSINTETKKRRIANDN